jgi:hypothetical protein
MGSEFTRQRAPTAKHPSFGAAQRPSATLAVNTPGDRYEQEADRVADEVVSGRGRAAGFSLSAVPITRVQREDAPQEKTDAEKLKEGASKLGEAFLGTPLGKDLLEKIKQDRLVKGATEAGKSFIGTLPGKIITGAAAAGAVATLAATHKELPAQIPEIPLDILTPGLSVAITYKGPVDKPTEAMITFKFVEQAPKGSSDKKPGMTESEKFQAETARIAADQARFRAGMKYPPGSPEDLQQQAEEAAVKRALAKFAPGPDLDAMAKKYSWLQVPQARSGLQLETPRPSFGYKLPPVLGDEYRLKLPGGLKKKEDEPGLQRKLRIGASHDPLEREADRVADQVLAAPAHSLGGGSAPPNRRHAGQATSCVDTAPASVGRVLAGSGRPLEPTLQQDMSRRFGYDFSQVRVHSGAHAEQSVRDVNAHAYTVGSNIVFDTGTFVPGTAEGRRLIAHELAHVVQQTGGVTLQRDQKKSDDDVIIHPKAMEFVEEKLRQLYVALPREERIALKDNRTVAIGAVRAKGRPDEPIYVYTTGSNWGTTAFHEAARRIGLQRWSGDAGVAQEKVGPSRNYPPTGPLPPGKGGIEHAEQFMIGFAENHGVEPSRGGAGGGTSVVGATFSGANRTLSAVLRQTQTEMMKLAQAHAGDTDLLDAVEKVNDVLDVKNFIDDPAGVAARRAKGALIQGVFDHFSASLEKARSAFVSTFPALASLHDDPLTTGISLDAYQQLYNEALAGLRRPEVRKTLLYAFVALGLTEETPDTVVEARLREADTALARMPGVAEYAKNYCRTQPPYALAVAVLRRDVQDLIEQLAIQFPGHADGLRRRGDALARAQVALDDVSLQLMNSGLIAFAPVEEAATELQTLAEGFGGLSAGLLEFASRVDNRRPEYIEELTRLEAQAKMINRPMLIVLAH